MMMVTLMLSCLYNIYSMSVNSNTNATSPVAVDRYVAERCITPQEACLEFNGNIFPKKELQEQLGLIRTNKALQNHKQVGDLIFDQSGQLKWIPKKLGDITKYPQVRMMTQKVLQ